MIMKPMAPASSYLPSSRVVECCLQTASQSKSGSQLLHGGMLSAGSFSKQIWELIAPGKVLRRAEEQKLLMVEMRRSGCLASGVKQMLSPFPSNSTPLRWRVSQRAAAESGPRI